MNQTEHNPNERAPLVVITAGATGLIGNELMKQMLEAEPIEAIYALSRKALPYFHPKLETLIHPELEVQTWTDDKPTPTYGFICLGTTRKQAGSKEALEHVDVKLVCEVASEMKLLGVTRLAVVSSYGASSRSLSHYLRCKGKMELTIERMGFEQVVFVRPGPLVGLRDKPRNDELVLQAVLKVARPLMIGPLRKLIPIHASDVARAMQYALFAKEKGHSRIRVLESPDMLALIERYR